MCTAVTLDAVVEHRDALRDANALTGQVRRKVVDASGMPDRIEQLRRDHRLGIVKSVAAGLVLIVGSALTAGAVLPADQYPDGVGLVIGFAIVVVIFASTWYLAGLGADLDEARNQLDRIHDLTVTLVDTEQLDLLDEIGSAATGDPDRTEDLLSAAVDLLTGGTAAPASI